MEEELDDLYSLAKKQIAAEDNKSVADIVKKIIYTNATGLLHEYMDGCPPTPSSDGINVIKIGNYDPFPVFCDTQLAGNGWVVIQRRVDGSLNFYQNWSMYKKGFGNISSEFFIGLDKLHAITSSRSHELYIRLEDFEGNSKYARYDEFLIGNEASSYQLSKLGTYSGTAGDSLSKHLYAKFSTYDNDNDDLDKHCALDSMGAWWYHAVQYCCWSSLNGLYLEGIIPNGFAEKGIYWHEWKGSMYSYKSVQMMIRPKCLHYY